MGLGGNDVEGWKIRPISGRVACQEAIALHRRVRPDEEIGQSSVPASAALSVERMRVACLERCFPWKVFADHVDAHQKALHFTDAIEANRNLEIGRASRR